MEANDPRLGIVVRAACAYVDAPDGDPDTQGLYEELRRAVENLRVPREGWDMFTNRPLSSHCEHKDIRLSTMEMPRKWRCLRCGKGWDKDPNAA